MDATSKESMGKKWLKLFIILLVCAGFIAAMYYWFTSDAENKFREISGGSEITSAELALAVLNNDEVNGNLNLNGSVRAQLPQFNNIIFKEDVQKYGYKDPVGRFFVAKKDGAVIVDNAVLFFDTPEKAQSFIETKAKESSAKTTLSFDSKIPTLVLTSIGDENSPPSSSIRFAVNNLTAKVTVYGKNSVIDYTDPALLTAEAQKLATVQKEKMEKLLAGQNQSSVNVYQTNMAMNNFPNSITGAKLIGKTYMSQEDWLGETLDPRESIPGFISGAYGRFLPESTSSTDGNADFILDVTIMEFAEPEDSVNELKGFLTTGANIMDKSSKELTLPQSLMSFSLGRISDSIAEIQATKRVYLYDISILPVGENFNKDQATKTLIEFSEKILK